MKIVVYSIIQVFDISFMNELTSKPDPNSYIFKKQSRHDFFFIEWALTALLT